MIYTLRAANVTDHDRRALVDFAAALPPNSELLVALRHIAAALYRGADITLAHLGTEQGA